MTDRTGLRASFSFTLEPGQLADPGEAADPPRDSFAELVIRTIEKQLGL